MHATMARSGPSGDGMKRTTVGSGCSSPPSNRRLGVQPKRPVRARRLAVDRAPSIGPRLPPPLIKQSELPSPEERLAAQEKANAAHHQLLVALHSRLVDQRWPEHPVLRARTSAQHIPATGRSSSRRKSCRMGVRCGSAEPHWRRCLSIASSMGRQITRSACSRTRRSKMHDCDSSTAGVVEMVLNEGHI
jgi:hypothetical protein